MSRSPSLLVQRRHLEAFQSHLLLPPLRSRSGLGTLLLLGRTRASWARALTARGGPKDLERSQRMLEQAEETAERLGGGLVTRGVAECRTTLAAISG